MSTSPESINYPESQDEPVATLEETTAASGNADCTTVPVVASAVETTSDAEAAAIPVPDSPAEVVTAPVPSDAETISIPENVFGEIPQSDEGETTEEVQPNSEIEIPTIDTAANGPAELAPPEIQAAAPLVEEPQADENASKAEGVLETESQEPSIRASDEEAEAITAWQPDAPISQDFDKTWQRIEEAFAEKKTLSALVVDAVKGGVLVDIGMQGFVPASHVSSGKVHDLDRFVGRTLKLRITDLDRERQRVVLSARIPLEEDHVRRKKETLDRLKVGLITDGVVRRLTEFGAFVDIGGIDGLLHVSEMGWSRVKHPKEAVSPGDHVKVKVLKISDDKKKISLGMRQLLPDPWGGIEGHYKLGEMVSGKVVRVVPFGAFVQIKDGVEAILPNSEVSARKPKAEELPQVGDTISAKVIELKADSRRMTLSIRRVQEEQDRKEYNDHVQSQTTKRPTIGDMFGDILSDWQSDRKD